MSSEVDKDSPIRSFVSIDTVLQDIELSNEKEENDDKKALVQQKLSGKELRYTDMKSDIPNVLHQHSYEKLEGFREPSFELTLKHENSANNQHSYSKYLNAKIKTDGVNPQELIRSIIMEGNDTLEHDCKH